MADGKTFTQDELNTIISDRLKEERTKIMKEVEEKEAELNRRESLMTVTADWKTRGLPVDLLPFLAADKYEDAAKAIEGYKKTFEPEVASRGGFSQDAVKKTEYKGASTDQRIRESMGLNRKD